MHPFAILAAVAVAALLIGLMLGTRTARWLLVAALVLTVASFAAYASGMNYSRTPGHWEVRSVAPGFAGATWFALYAASGLFGPALTNRRAVAVVLSVGATLLTLTAGTYVLFSLACGFAGDCI